VVLFMDLKQTQNNVHINIIIKKRKKEKGKAFPVPHQPMAIPYRFRLVLFMIFQLGSIATVGKKKKEKMEGKVAYSTMSDILGNVNRGSLAPAVLPMYILYACMLATRGNGNLKLTFFFFFFFFFFK